VFQFIFRLPAELTSSANIESATEVYSSTL